MKTLIITLLFCSVVVGQGITGTEWTISTYYNFLEDEIDVIVGKDTVNNAKGAYQTMVMLTILQQWDEYSAECYAKKTLKQRKRTTVC